MDEIVRNYGYLGDKEDLDQHFYVTKGQWIAGYTVGIMLLDVHYPLLPAVTGLLSALLVILG